MTLFQLRVSILQFTDTIFDFKANNARIGMMETYNTQSLIKRLFDILILSLAVSLAKSRIQMVTYCLRVIRYRHEFR
jgi:hypothetical protein